MCRTKSPGRWIRSRSRPFRRVLRSQAAGEKRFASHRRRYHVFLSKEKHRKVGHNLGPKSAWESIGTTSQPRFSSADWVYPSNPEEDLNWPMSKIRFIWTFQGGHRGFVQSFLQAWESTDAKWETHYGGGDILSWVEATAQG